ncbi:MAG: hypothetical protein WCG44_02960 [bacterium]
MPINYSELAKAFDGQQNQGGRKEGEPKTTPQPSIIEKLGTKPISQVDLQTLAMMAIAQASEQKGFESGVAATEATHNKVSQPATFYSRAQALLVDALTLPEKMDPEALLKLSQTPLEKNLDKVASASKKGATRLGKAIVGLVIANLPTEFQPKSKK